MVDRKDLQNGAGKVIGRLTEATGNLRDSGGTTARILDAGVKGVTTVVKGVSHLSDAAVGRATRFIGLDRYRKELEAALDEATRVIATQEARIARLEDELGKRAP